jgi:hypothetical protein
MPVFSSRPLESGPSDAELAASGVPDTSPTWELELLISGAVLFALFQLPSLLNGFFARIEPHATTAAIPVMLFVQIYVRAIIYALIACFVVHLISRAYWVGLVGLHSVFPNGVRWENFKSGPVTLEVYRARLVSLPAIISRTDNFCSVIFSFAFLLVLLFAFTVTVTGTYSIIGYLISRVSHLKAQSVFIWLALITALVPAFTNLVDRRYGARLGPRGKSALRRLVIISYRGTAQSVISPIFIPLITNVGRAKMVAIFYFALFGILTVVIAERFARNDQLSLNSYDYYAASNRFGVDYRLYENQRSPDDIYPRLPSIQSDIITGSYVKLFIPYYPRRHNDAVAKTCPALHPIQSRGLQLGSDTPVPDSLAIPVLECLARIHGVTLDGAPRHDLQFRFYEHPATGIKGIITYIPADSLTRGQHVIVVRQVPSPDSTVADPAPVTIPFWR